jgi:hypothetical protein
MPAGRRPGFALNLTALTSVHTMARTWEQVRAALMGGLSCAWHAQAAVTVRAAPGAPGAARLP